MPITLESAARIARMQAMQEFLWRRTSPDLHVFALLDGASDPRIYPMLLNSNASFASLYRGNTAYHLAHVAPYILRLETENKLTETILYDGGTQHWGLFLHACATLESLTEHFRRLTLVQDENGRLLYFRFYDPRVLRTYLPTCTAEEHKYMFGPIERFFVEDEDPHILLEFVPEDPLPRRRTLYDKQPS